jgi:hypothetical protein
VLSALVMDALRGTVPHCKIACNNDPLRGGFRVQ